jgi:hypothetical protein
MPPRPDAVDGESLGALRGKCLVPWRGRVFITADYRKTVMAPGREPWGLEGSGLGAYFKLRGESQRDRRSSSTPRGYLA